MSLLWQTGLPLAWWKALEEAGVDGTPGDDVTFYDLLIVIAGQRQLGSLHRQLLYQLAVCLEMALMISLRKGSGLGQVKVKHDNIMDLLQDPKRLCHELHRYRLSCIEVIRSTLNLIFATDKANCNGLNLFNSVLASPDNKGMLLVPQVVLIPKQL